MRRLLLVAKSQEEGKSHGRENSPAGWETDGASGIGSRLAEAGILDRLSTKIGANAE